MSVLPISEAIPIPEVGYWGWGGSNQSTSNYPNARNLGPGMAEPDLQSDLYVADVAADIGPLEARVTVLEGQTATIESDITDINTEISDIEADIIALQGAIVPVTFAPIGNLPNANAATVVSNQITLQPASATLGGLVSNTTQSFLGDKTIVGNISATNLSGLNTGNVSLAGVGAIPNANGASLVGQTLNLQPANSTNPGLITATGQTIGGSKTFVDSVTAAGLTTTTGIAMPNTSSASVGTLQQPAGTTLFHTGSGNAIYIGKDGANTSAPNNNVAVGYQALKAVSTGNNNVCVGRQAGTALGTGIYNVMVGDAAGASVSSGSGNVLIGRAAGGSTSGTLNGCVMIGSMFGVTVPNPTSSAIVLGGDGVSGISTGKMILGNSTTSNTVITGISGTAVAADQMVVISSVSKQLGSAQFIDDTINTTPTIDFGTITSSTVRGSPGTSIPITLSKRGRVVTMVIAAFVITAQSAASGNITLTGGTPLPTTYRPVFNMAVRCDMTDNGGFVSGVLYISPGGTIQLQLATGLPFALPSGMSYDFPISWNAAT